MIVLPNQPIHLSDGNSTCELSEMKYNQLAKGGDILEFQLELEPCGDAIPVDLSTWTSDLSTWEYAAGELCKLNTTDDPVTIPNLGIAASTFYRITIVVTDCSGSYNAFLGGAFIGTFSAAGTYVFYATSGTSNDDFLMGGADGIETCCISSIAITQFENLFQVYVLDTDNTLVSWFDKVTNAAWFDYYNQYVKVKLEISELGVDNLECFYIALSTGCNGLSNLLEDLEPIAISNYDFSTNLFWTVGFTPVGDCEILVNGDGAGKLIINSGTSGTASILHTTAVVNNNAWYLVKYTVSNINEATVQIKLGENGDGVLRSTNGTFIELIESNSATTASLIVEMYGDQSSETATAWIDDIYLYPIGTSLTYELRSNPFELTSDTCTRLISATCSADAMGFEFVETGFNPKLRLNARILPASEPYTGEKLDHTTSAGVKHNYYFSRRKKQILSVKLEPEFIHDFLSTLAGYDTLTIDGTAYTMEDDEYPVIDWNVSRTKGKVQLEIAEKTQNIVNRKES
jgi:hypothetical protein